MVVVIVTLVCEGVGVNSNTGVGGVGVIVVMTGVGGVGVIVGVIVIQAIHICNNNEYTEHVQGSAASNETHALTHILQFLLLVLATPKLSLFQYGLV